MCKKTILKKKEMVIIQFPGEEEQIEIPKKDFVAIIRSLMQLINLWKAELNRKKEEIKNEYMSKMRS